MRFRLALAVSISILLIGVASWHRFSTTEYAKSNIIAVEESTTNNNYKSLLDQVVEPPPDATSETSPVKPLTGAELISHGLILDYVNLATSGQATDATIEALADRYVESIPTLNKALIITYADIKVVSNTKTNFQNYKSRLEEIYKEYTDDVSRKYAEAGSPNTSEKAMYPFLLTFSTIYKETASKLQKMPVPASLATLHVQLVNGYLSNASGMEAISKTEQDSASAFAGLIALNENLKKEDVLMAEISKILALNGI